MVTLNFKDCEDKNEKEYIQPFVEFYLDSRFPQMSVVDVESPEKKGGGPDYFLAQPRILVEIKRVVDKEWVENVVPWKGNIERLEKELYSRDFSSICGRYSIRVPFGLKIRDKKVPKVINDIINAIVNRQLMEDKYTDVDIAGVGTFAIRKSRLQGPHPVVLVGPTLTREVGNIIRDNMGHVIERANEQLATYRYNKVEKKILLLVDKYFLANEGWYAGAFRVLYERVSNCKNIDEIWIQFLEPSLYHVQYFSRDWTYGEFDEALRKIEQQWIAEVTGSKGAEG